MMSTIEELAQRKSNNKIGCCNPVGRHITDVDCVYETGRFVLQCVPPDLPELFTIRFTAPADYTQGDVIAIGDKEFPVRTSGMTSAASGNFVAGVVIHCDIDLDREIAFLWQGASDGISGVLPNLSYDEQFAGYRDEDGKKVYMKSLNFGNLLSDSVKAVPHNITNISRLVSMTSRWYTTISGSMRCVNSYTSTSLSGRADFFVDGENVSCEAYGAGMRNVEVIVVMWIVCRLRQYSKNPLPVFRPSCPALTIFFSNGQGRYFGSPRSVYSWVMTARTVSRPA